MKPREIFHLSIRLLGLFFVAFGCLNLSSAWQLIMTNHWPFGLFVLIFPFIVARWLVGGGEPIMRIAFPSENPNENPAVSGTATFLVLILGDGVESAVYPWLRAALTLHFPRSS
jgi:hypothetical protein